MKVRSAMISRPSANTRLTVRSCGRRRARRGRNCLVRRRTWIPVVRPNEPQDVCGEIVPSAFEPLRGRDCSRTVGQARPSAVLALDETLRQPRRTAVPLVGCRGAAPGSAAVGASAQAGTRWKSRGNCASAPHRAAGPTGPGSRRCSLPERRHWIGSDVRVRRDDRQSVHGCL